MPKRAKSAVAADAAPAPEPDGELEPLGGEELDLYSDEDPSDGEGGSSEGGEEASEEGSDGEDDSAASEDDEELREALVEYMAAANAQERPADAAGDGQPAETSGRDHAAPEDPGSDSSEDERPNRNTIGAVPLRWYKDEEHIGYDRAGGKLLRKQRGDRLEALLKRSDAEGSSRALRTVYDEYNDEEVVLSKEELRMIMRIRRGQFPHVEVNPYEPYLDYFSGDVDPTPIINAPEPKRRFVPSKWEEKKIVQLVRAIRKGWLRTGKQKREAKQQPMYLMWGDDDQIAEKTGSHLTYIPPAKPKLPGHEESYNPPREYVPTEEERAGWELLPPEERPQFEPKAFDCLRHVPLYERFIQERFERCLDLYLCPRVRKKRLFVDPKSLEPKLPKPQDLQPFPATLCARFSGHTARVRSLSPHPSGQWLASGGDDGTVRLWEVATGRCSASWQLGEPVSCVAWCPAPGLQLLGCVAGKRVVLLLSGLGGEEVEAAAREACKVPAAAAGAGQEQQPLARWETRPDGGLELHTQHPVKQLTWHARGDYFASVAPTGATQSVLVHQLSRRATQNPFRKNRGRVTRASFHPTKPFFFVATQNAVRVYNLAKQALAKKLIGGSGVISCLAVHPSGDHVLAGSEDKRLAWYDLDLSTKPYRALRYHAAALRGCAFHPTYPLFASASDDGTAHVFHGRVYADLMTNPLIVPVKILRGHRVVDSSGVTDCAFHPTQPWLFTAGGDGEVLLFCN